MSGLSGEETLAVSKGDNPEQDDVLGIAPAVFPTPFVSFSYHALLSCRQVATSIWCKLIRFM